jgi:hypothetical protein
MTADRYEAHLEARLQAYASVMDRAIDDRAVARAAIAQARRDRGAGPLGRLRAVLANPVVVRSDWRPLHPLFLLLLVGLLVIALAAGALLVGSWLQAPPDSSMKPAPQPTRTASGFLPPTQPPKPWAGRFDATGDLRYPRSHATALLLQDGRVLVLGGNPFDAHTVPPEIYDPASGVFTSIDPIVPAIDASVDDEVGYRDFSATVLADGRVLIAGGRIQIRDANLPDSVAGPAPMLSAEAVIFDPATQATAPTGPMGVPRAGHAAVRLGDGRILIVGGITPDGAGGEGSAASAELYDPATGTFSATGDMAGDRATVDQASASFQAVALPSGRILISGGDTYHVDRDGLGGGGPTFPPEELYDPTAGTFAQVPAAVDPGDRVVLLPSGDRVDRLDLATGVRTDITPEPTELVSKFGTHCHDLPFDCRVGMTTTLLAAGGILIAGGSIYVVDGLDVRRVAQTWAEILDPGNLRVMPTGPLVEPRMNHTAVVLADGRVLLLGGLRPGLDGAFGRSVLGSAEVFTPE